MERIESQEFAERSAQVLRIAARRDVADTYIVGIAAIAKRQIQVAVRAERAGATVMIAGGLAKGNHLAARRWINDAGVSARNLPLVEDVLIIVRRGSGNGECGWCVRWLTVVGVERAVAGAGGIGVARVESNAQQPTLIVRAGRDQRRSDPSL